MTTTPQNTHHHFVFANGQTFHVETRPDQYDAIAAFDCSDQSADLSTDILDALIIALERVAEELGTRSAASWILLPTGRAIHLIGKSTGKTHASRDRNYLLHIYQSPRGTVLESLRRSNASVGSTLAYKPRHIAGPPPTASEEIDAVMAIWQQQADEEQHPTRCNWPLPSGRILSFVCEPNAPTATARDEKPATDRELENFFANLKSMLD
jgi:hypothetical protein